MANRADSLIPACFDINSVIIIRFRIRSFQMKLITITSWRCLGRELGRWWLCCHWFRCRWICCYLCCRFWILCRWFFRCCRLKKLSLSCCFNQLADRSESSYLCCCIVGVNTPSTITSANISHSIGIWIPD